MGDRIDPAELARANVVYALMVKTQHAADLARLAWQSYSAEVQEAVRAPLRPKEESPSGG